MSPMGFQKNRVDRRSWESDSFIHNITPPVDASAADKIPADSKLLPAGKSQLR